MPKGLKRNEKDMDIRKVIYFLNILRSNTTGHSEELANIYKKALDESDAVADLKKLLDGANYYGIIGKNLYNEGKNKIKELYDAPSHALDLLPEIVQCAESINLQVKISQNILKNSHQTMETVSVIKKKDVIAYFEAYKMIANVSVYMSCLYGGIDSIKYMSWNDSVGIQEMIYLINTKYLPLLCAIKRYNDSWVIRKRNLGGKALFGGDAFYITYENTRKVDVLCSALHKEPMGTHSFLNIDAYETNENDVPFCWGIGNIISFSPNEALSYLQKDIATRVATPTNIHFKGKMPTPIECIKKLSGGRPFCLTPEEFTKVLNQWVIGKEIEDRKRTHNCLFCNRYINGNKLVCDSHFISEL